MSKAGNKQANQTESMLLTKAIDLERSDLRKFLAQSDFMSYPEDTFSGRGIVMVGGGVKYAIPAYVSLYALRRTGCSLPVELWLLPEEALPAGLRMKFERLGAEVRDFAEVVPNADEVVKTYQTKVVALMASRFEEIIFLDADNIALRDPAFLFEHKLYTQHGLILWPDFWPAQVQSLVYDMLGMSPQQHLNATHETGQIVLNKRHGWRQLLVSLYINWKGELYYPYLSDVGQGDKETFAMAWALTGSSYGLVPHPVTAVGFTDEENNFHGTSMLQTDPDGQPLFLHTHFPKVNLIQPETSSTTPRRWKQLQGRPEAADELIQRVTGYNLEQEVIKLTRHMRCDQHWVKWIVARKQQHDRFFETNHLHDRWQQAEELGEQPWSDCLFELKE
eukprot:jgi/Chrzof1/6855/Cz02g01020.t1